MTKSPGDEPTNLTASRGGEIQVDLFGRTDVGLIREHNEDDFIVADLSRGLRSLAPEHRQVSLGPRGYLLGVCDGMGGAAAGEVASQLAVDTIFEQMSADEAPRDHDELARRLVRAVEVAGARIFNEAKLNRARRGMGTTSTVAALVDDHLFLAQVGDSRAYVLRGDRLVQVTRDQSLVNQLIEAGQLTEEEAETFEHNNIILQALGTADVVDVDLTYVTLRRGDRLMLCSDGLSGMVRFEAIREVLKNTSPIEACEALTHMANQAGGHDNITVVVAHFDGPGLPLPSEADEELRYRKYDFSIPRQEQVTARDLDRAPGYSTAPPAHEELTPTDNPTGRAHDHGPSRSKLAHTIVGDSLGDSLAQALEAGPADFAEGSPREEDEAPDSGPISSGPISDDFVIPTNKTPWWVLTLLALGAVALAALAGSYLLGD